MASATASQMLIFETAVSVKMVTMTYRILMSTAVNVSTGFPKTV